MLSVIKMSFWQYVGTLLIALVILVGGIMVIVKVTTDYLLYRDATTIARNWARYLTESVTDLAQIASGEQPSVASMTFFSAAQKAGSVFRYEIFNRNGFSMLVSDQDKIALVDLSEYSADAARSSATGSAVVDAKEGQLPDLPLFFAEAYVPVLVGGRPVAIVAAYVDQTERRDDFYKVFLMSGAALCGLTVLSLGIPTIAWYHRTKEKQEADRRIHVLSQNDMRYLAWLRQLAEFLRHEVRHPVAQINSSIEIVQLACKDDHRIKPYLASAALATQEVWNLVERASQATDAEAFVRQGQPQWIDLAELIADQIEGFRRTNSGTNFHLQSGGDARVYADPTLIKEAIGNLLANGASFADDESTVEVALTVDKAYAAIKVTNKGPAVEGDTEKLFGPFASTRAGPSSEHQGIGLYLVRLIAEQHGGTASIANLEDGSGVQASILLPLGT
jgi:signal transduction histidine kinase